MGNNSRTHPPFFSRHLTLQNLRNINFLDFSIFDVLDACLMVHGSWLKAHGSWPREARGGSWPGAGLALGTQRRAGPDPDRKRASGSPGPGRHLAMSHEPPLASLGHEP